MGKESWVKTRLADLCDSVEYGFTQAATDVPEGPKFLRITDIVKEIVDWDEVPYCQVEPATAQKYRLHHGDIVIARTGASTGCSAYINHPPRAVFASYLIRLRINERADSRFISYFLKSPKFWKYIESVRGDKSAQPNASAKTLTQVELDLPPLEEQRAISSILASLDEKIELNHKMNITFEQIAQTLFKRWFVDFEFHGKEGEPLESSLGAMRDPNIRFMPKEWELKRLGDVVAINAKRIGKDYPFETIEYVDISSVKAGYLLNTKRYELKDAPSRAQMLVSHGDTIWSAVRPNRKSFLFINNPSANLVVSTGFVVLTPNKIRPCYLYYWVTTDEFVNYLSSNADGSAYPAVRPNHFAEALIVVPDEYRLNLFEQSVEPLRNKITENEQENIILRDIRDMLMHGLMSGLLVGRRSTLAGTFARANRVFTSKRS
jgi:type I restriction enzyme S subunit